MDLEDSTWTFNKDEKEKENEFNGETIASKLVVFAMNTACKMEI